jgi:hypothetical protein
MLFRCLELLNNRDSHQFSLDYSRHAPVSSHAPVTMSPMHAETCPPAGIRAFAIICIIAELQGYRLGGGFDPSCLLPAVETAG